eukprot:10884069-Prorocentrum_lima.AAC.1
MLGTYEIRIVNLRNFSEFRGIVPAVALALNQGVDLARKYLLRGSSHMYAEVLKTKPFSITIVHGPTDTRTELALSERGGVDGHKLQRDPIRMEQGLLTQASEKCARWCL